VCHCCNHFIVFSSFYAYHYNATMSVYMSPAGWYALLVVSLNCSLDWHSAIWASTMMMMMITLGKEQHGVEQLAERYEAVAISVYDWKHLTYEQRVRLQSQSFRELSLQAISLRQVDCETIIIVKVNRLSRLWNLCDVQYALQQQQLHPRITAICFIIIIIIIIKFLAYSDTYMIDIETMFNTNYASRVNKALTTTR